MTAIFDTHAHYDDDAFNEDREQLFIPRSIVNSIILNL